MKYTIQSIVYKEVHKSRSRLGLHLLARACAGLALVLPGLASGVSIIDEIGGDGFDGFDLTPCDGSLASNSSVAAEYANALDLCATTTEGSFAPGLISATFALAGGSGTPNAVSHSIRPQYGTGTTPRRGSALALLSTGTAAGSGDINPSFFGPQSSTSFGFLQGTTSSLPGDWLANNAGQVPNLPACPPISSTTAFDPVLLKLRIRVPNNARSFSLDASYFASDYPEWTCSNFNDVFVALLGAQFGAASNPADGNLATFDGVPATVNLALLPAGPFRQCVNGALGCQSMNAGTALSCTSTAQLAGTGMDVTSGLTSNDTCGTVGAQVGGGTGWFEMRGNVLPGDIIELRLAIWDSGDGTYDSDVALDNFRWSHLPATAGATPATP